MKNNFNERWFWHSIKFSVKMVSVIFLAVFKVYNFSRLPYNIISKVQW